MLEVVAWSYEPFHEAGSKRFDWRRKAVLVWHRLGDTIPTWEVPVPFDTDVAGLVLPVASVVGTDLVPDMDHTAWDGLAVRDGHVAAVAVPGRIEDRAGTADLPDRRRLGSWPTCRRRFSCRNREGSPG